MLDLSGLKPDRSLRRNSVTLRKKMKMQAINLLITALLVFGLCSKDDTTNPEDGQTYKNVPYASISPAQKMDIYLPAGTGPFPVVVLIHGGAFRVGDKGGEASNAKALVAAGFASASINYRLSGEAKFPAQIRDCKAAVRFLRANAKKYHLDPNGIGSWGESAGGYLSAMLGTTAGIKELEGDDLGNPDYPSRVKASVDWYGPINFLTMESEAAALGFTITTNSADSPESELMGAPVQTIPAKVANANPTTFISTDDAAFFIQAGSMDRNIPYTQSLNFYNALVPVIGSDHVSYELLEGAGHGGPKFTSEANIAKVIAFFEKYLK